MPTFGSLFSGIGGFDLGLERAGWECKWQVEIDLFCQRVLEKHWPDIPRYGDIRSVAELESVELICGGFPCQPFSRAGLRRGTKDDRWLWPEFARIIRTLRPHYVLVENVTGLTSHGLGDVLTDLAASGYDAEWDCLPAAAFGAPHIRDRLYLLAYSSERRPIPSGQTIFAGWTRAQLHAGWTPEPDVDRVADGLPKWAYRARRRVLGAAVVPQVAQWIGEQLMDFLCGQGER